MISDEQLEQWATVIESDGRRRALGGSEWDETRAEMAREILARYPHRFRVIRHGGRSTDTPRPLYQGDDEARAGSVYDRARIALRQGTVELFERHTLKHRAAGPRLRTRW